MKRYPVYRSSLPPFCRTVGSLALALAVTTLVLKRFGVIDPDTFVLSLIGTAIVSLFAVIVALLAMNRIWVHGGGGVMSSVGGLLFGLLALLAPAVVVVLLVISPAATDLTTDLVDPPLVKRDITEQAPLVDWVSVKLQSSFWPALARDTETRSADQDIQEELYPDLVSRRYRISPGHLHVAGTKALDELNWKIVDELPPDLLDAPTRLQAEQTSIILGLTHDVTLRIRPDDVGSLLDIRSRSRTPLRDLTDNADHIRKLFAEIDRVLLETYGEIARLETEQEGLEEQNLQSVPVDEQRETIPVPSFKPYIEGEEETLPPDTLELTDLEG